MKRVALCVAVAACAKLANVPGYTLEDDGGRPPGSDADGGSGSGSACVAWSASSGCVTALVAGYHRTCAIAGSNLYCWGKVPGNNMSAVGKPTFIDDDVVDVSTSTDSTNDTYGVTCYTKLGSGSGTYCWGDGNVDQQQNDTTSVVTQQLSSKIYAHLGVGGDHVCGSTTGGVECWGANEYAQLGDESSTATCSFPGDVPGMCSKLPLMADSDPTIVSIAAGESHTCVLASGGAVVCWGSDSDGQIGNGNNDSAIALPYPVALPDLAVQIAAGDLHSCARSGSGAWACWGADGNDQLDTGSGNDQYVPVWHDGSNDPRFTAIAAGAQNTCAIAPDGGVSCWGDNSTGVTGIALGGSAMAPQSIVDLDHAMLVAVGFDHACAAIASGAIMCWGDDADGELGDNSSIGTATGMPQTAIAPQ